MEKQKFGDLPHAPKKRYLLIHSIPGRIDRTWSVDGSSWGALVSLMYNTAMEAFAKADVLRNSEQFAGQRMRVVDVERNYEVDSLGLWSLGYKPADDNDQGQVRP